MILSNFAGDPSHHCRTLRDDQSASSDCWLVQVTLKGFGLSKSKASIGVMTSAVLDDIGSLALVAIMVPLLTSDDGVSAVDIIIILCKAGGFFALVAVICKFVFPERIRMNFCCMPDTFCKKPGLRHLMKVDRHQSTLLILMIGLGFGMLAHVLGFHPGIGAYMGALIIKKAYFLDYHDKEPDELGEAHRAKQNLEQDADSFEVPFTLCPSALSHNRHSAFRCRFLSRIPTSVKCCWLTVRCFRLSRMQLTTLPCHGWGQSSLLFLAPSSKSRLTCLKRPSCKSLFFTSSWSLFSSYRQVSQPGISAFFASHSPSRNDC